MWTYFYIVLTALDLSTQTMTERQQDCISNFTSSNNIVIIFLNMFKNLPLYFEHLGFYFISRKPSKIKLKFKKYY